MKIINLDQFLKMPSGTVYQQYDPCSAQEICIKHESLEGLNDWYYQPICGVDAADASSGDDLVDKLLQAEHTGESYDIDLFCLLREGMHPEEQSFIVWETGDIQKLIGRLSDSISTHVNPELLEK